ncbi:MAG: hypothetical protein RLY90_1479, partial [Pseudomonadota bacterium]
AGDEQTHGQHRGQVPQHGEAHDQTDLRRIDAALRSLAQRADEHHGHHDGDQDDERGAEAACELFAEGGME